MAYIEVFNTGSTVSEPEQMADELPEAIEDHTAQLGAFQVSLGALSEETQPGTWVSLLAIHTSQNTRRKSSS